MKKISTILTALLFFVMANATDPLYLRGTMNGYFLTDKFTETGQDSGELWLVKNLTGGSYSYVIANADYTWKSSSTDETLVLNNNDLVRWTVSGWQITPGSSRKMTVVKEGKFYVKVNNETRYLMHDDGGFAYSLNNLQIKNAQSWQIVSDDDNGSEQVLYSGSGFVYSGSNVRASFYYDFGFSYDMKGYKTQEIVLQNDLEYQIKIGQEIVGSELTTDFSKEVSIPCDVEGVKLLSRKQGSNDTYVEESLIDINQIYKGGPANLSFTFLTTEINFTNNPEISVLCNSTPLIKGDNWLLITGEEFNYTLTKMFNGCSNGAVVLNSKISGYNGRKANYKMDELGNVTVLTPLFTIDFGGGGIEWDGATFNQDANDPTKFTLLLDLKAPLNENMLYWIGYNNGENHLPTFGGFSNTVKIKSIPGLENLTISKIKLTVNINNTGANWSPQGEANVTNVNELESDGFKLRILNKSIIIESRISSKLKIYEILGRKVAESEITQGTNTVKMNPGIYIIELNGIKNKLIIK